MRRALRQADVEPGTVDYVEAHGTGTAVGDPLEAAALGSVYGAGRSADRPCLIGSAKSNIGHLEGAAGIAGLVKAVLALHCGELPPGFVDVFHPEIRKCVQDRVGFVSLPQVPLHRCDPDPGAGELGRYDVAGLLAPLIEQDRELVGDGP